MAANEGPQSSAWELTDTGEVEEVEVTGLGWQHVGSGAPRGWENTDSP